jgi:lipoprotein-releasing system ATP-binding protein
VATTLDGRAGGSALVVEGLVKEYLTPAGALRVLDGVDLKLARGQAMAVTGPSGSGKSTLLHLLGTLEPPTSGSVRLVGQDPFQLSPRDLAAFRNRHVGFVFQDHCLLPQCSALENVLVPTVVADRAADHEARARALLEQVGLADRLDHRPAALSGGERQRVAVARALILEPTLLLCDEPTGNLDHDTGEAVAGLLLDLHRRLGTVLVVVTHSGALAARFERRQRLVGGRFVDASAA